MSDKKTFSYKSYEGSMEFSEEDECLFGQILFIRDSVLYQGETYPELKSAFEEAVDQYLADCERIGRAPNKPFTGSFNIRIGQDRHRSLASLAHKRDVSLNSLVAQGIDLLLDSVAIGAELSGALTFTTKIDAVADYSNTLWKPVKPKLSVVSH